MSWAVVAGASEGLGAAFAAGLAARGHGLVLVARRVERLEALAATLRERHRVEVECVGLDLADADAVPRLVATLGDREIGVLVCNAAFAPLGAFVDQSAADLETALAVNCRAPLLLVHALLPAMVARRKGSIIWMSSLTAFQGSPWTSVYGATKAFGLAFAEGLWGEVEASGVQVLVCAAGATRTPNYLAHAAKGGAPGELDPEQVVAETLRHLGRGPLLIPGAFNRFASFLMRRVLPRVTTIRIMAGQTKKLEG